MGNKSRTADFGFLVMLALMILLLPLRWLIATLMASIIHETGHCVAVLLCKGRVSQIRLGFFHSVMEVEPLPLWQEFLCISAGPAAGLLPLLLSRWYPLTAVCGFVQTVYNLLPIYPLDGGRLVRCLAKLLNLTQRQLYALETVFIFILLILIIILGVKLGFYAFLGGCLLLVRAISGKIPCKHR